MCKLARYFETVPLSTSIREFPFVLLKLSESTDSSRLRSFMTNPASISLVHESLSHEELLGIWSRIGDFVITTSDMAVGNCTAGAVRAILRIAENFHSTASLALFVLELSQRNQFRGTEYSFIFAYYLEKNGNYVEAAELLELASQNSAPSLEVLSLLGVIKKKQGLYQEASDIYNRCCDRIATSEQKDRSALAEFKLLLGDVERKQGKTFVRPEHEVSQ